MEFLGFEAPAVSAPLALQQRRSLGFAAWALINDPANARFALDLVKRMKAAARQAQTRCSLTLPHRAEPLSYHAQTPITSGKLTKLRASL